MNEELFRKKDPDKVKSLENLDDYIRVSNPGIWLLLVSVIVLLAGACVWGIFGRIDSTVPSAVCVDDGRAVCYLADEDASDVQIGMTVEFADSEAVILHIEDNGGNGYVCTLSQDFSLPDGSYEGRVVVERHRPISFILN